MDKTVARNDDKDPFWKDEAHAQRVVRRVSLARCVLGPVVIFGFLLATAHWEPASASPQNVAAHSTAGYFPAGYVNSASKLEEHVQAF